MPNTQVSEKNTKADILKAYKAAQAEVKQLKAQKLNPVAEKKAKRKTATAEKVKELTVDSVAKTIETLNSRTDNYLSQLREEFEGELGNLTEVRQAVADAKEELKEIFDIQAEAESLASLIEAQSNKKTEFDAKMQADREAHLDEMQRERKAWETEKADYEAEWERKVKEDQERRTRELADAKYLFERDKREQTDALEDELNSKRKAFMDQIEVAEKNLKEQRETFFKDKKTTEQLEAAVKALEERVVTFEGEKRDAIEAAREEGKKKAAQSYGIETSALKRSHEADVKVLQGQVDNLSADNDGLRNQVKSLEAKLETAYSKVQDVAVQALTAQGNANTVAQVQTAVSAATGSKK